MPKSRSKSQYEILQDVKYFDDITTLQIIMAIERKSGACFAREVYNQGDGIQANFISGFLTAFSSFEKVIGEQLGLDDAEIEKLKAIQYGDFTISIVDSGVLRLSLISSNPIGNITRDKCRTLLKRYEKAHLYDLLKFSGNMDIYDDFHNYVTKELDIKLNYKSTINEDSLDRYDGPKGVKKVLKHMAQMGDEFYPVKVPPILVREANLTETMAKFYTFDAYLWYIFNFNEK